MTEAAPNPLEELLRAVPKLVDRTRSQAELARSLVGYLPCLGALVPARSAEPSPGRPEREDVSVLTVLGDGVPDLAVVEPSGSSGGDVAVETVAEAVTVSPPPLEAELPVRDYDSLAASQVVPRLATLTPEQLLSVQSYELANRNRQTILNRVAQLLAT